MGRRKKTSIPYEMIGGAAVGAGASVLVNKLTANVPTIATNPMLGGVAKIAAGVGVVLYGGKSKFVQGIGIGMAAAGGKQVLDTTGVFNNLLASGDVGAMPPLDRYRERRNPIMDFAPGSGRMAA